MNINYVDVKISSREETVECDRSLLPTTQGRRKVKMGGGGAISNVVDIICPPPLGEIGLIDLSKSGGGGAPLPHRFRRAYTTYCCSSKNIAARTLWAKFGKNVLGFLLLFLNYFPSV